MNKDKRVKLVINNNEKSLKIAEKVKKQLLDKDFEIVEEDYSLAISIGGDGAFLRMVKETGFNENIFDFDQDIYGVEIEVQLLYFVRPEQRFASLDELAAQMKADAEFGKNYTKNYCNNYFQNIV